jgi:acetyl esterase
MITIACKEVVRSVTVRKRRLIYIHLGRRVMVRTWIIVALFIQCLSQPADAATNSQLTTIEYKRVGAEPLLLDVCVPAQDAKTNLRPVVIAVHGGGWGSGDRKTDFPPVLRALTEGGYIYVSMDYRLSPKHRWPACREDVDDAVAWSKAHIREHGGNPDRMAILGYSAGGQLAFWSAIRDQPPHRLKCVIGLAPATDFLEDLGRRSGPSKALRDLMNCEVDEPFEKTVLRLYEASPINHLHERMPPILLIHGTEDRSVPFQQSLHIQHKIQEKRWKLECEIYKIEGAPHRQTEWDKFDLGYKQKLIEWLGQRL